MQPRRVGFSKKIKECDNNRESRDSVAQHFLSEMDSSRLQRLGKIFSTLLFPMVFGLGGWARFCPPSAVVRVHFCLAGGDRGVQHTKQKGAAKNKKVRKITVVLFGVFSGKAYFAQKMR